MKWVSWEQRASPQSWAFARDRASRGDSFDLWRHVHRHVRQYFGARAIVGRLREHLVVSPTDRARWLVRLRVTGLRVAVYCWPAGGDEVEVEALPDTLDAALAPSGPRPVPALDGPEAADMLGAYRWRCTWCEDVLRDRFGWSVRLSAAPWLDDLRVNPPGPYLRIVVRALPPFYHIGHGRNVRYPLFTEAVRLDGPPARDRERLLAAVEPRPLASAPHSRNRGYWPPRIV